MDAIRRDPAARWLLLLATVALLASWVALSHANRRSVSRTQPLDPGRIAMHQRRIDASSRVVSNLPTSPTLANSSAEPDSGWELFLDLDLWRSDLAPNLDPLQLLLDANRAASSDLLAVGELVLLLPGRPQHSARRGELVVLIPVEPRWRAGAQRNALARNVKRATRQGLRELGAAIAHLQPIVDRAASQLGGLIAAAEGSTRPEASRRSSGVIMSPPKLRGPQVSSSADRLAMAPTRHAPSLELHRSEPQQLKAPPVIAKPHAPTFPFPASLVEDLEALRDAPATACWADHVLGTIDALCKPTSSSDNVEAELDRLRDAVNDAAGLEESCSPSAAKRLRRVQHAIRRRADSWRLTHLLNQREESFLAHDSSEVDAAVRQRLELVLDRLSGGRQGDNWGRYLLAPRLEQALASPARLSEGDRRRLAQQVLARISSEELSDRQHRFVSAGPVAQLGDELRVWAEAPIDLVSLQTNLERYEESRSPHVAAAVARDIQQLAWSASAPRVALAESLDEHYRNANLRVAISRDLLQRRLPQPGPAEEPVRDNIAGAPVTGHSVTETKLSIRMLDDPTAWKFGLEARGEVLSRTASRGGPAVLSSRGETTFLAKKLIILDSRGLSSLPAIAEAQSRSHLTGVSTSFDGLPILRGIVRSAVRDEYAAVKPRATLEVEEKVRQKASSTLDAELEPWLTEIERQYRTRVLTRATHLGLTIEPVELRTSADRLIARLRVANQQQLAANTPRNRAPADSLLSLQMHESLINNAVAGLGLTGREWSTDELRQQMIDQFSLVPGADDGENATIRFADIDPVVLTFSGGRAELTLSVSELTVRGARLNDFKIHVFYRPRAEGAAAWLERDGGVGVEGDMRTGSRMRLYGIFGKVFSEDRPIPILRSPASGDDPLEGLVVSQLVIEDGWLGIALGPEQRQAVAEVGRYIR